MRVIPLCAMPQDKQPIKEHAKQCGQVTGGDYAHGISCEKPMMPFQGRFAPDDVRTISSKDKKPEDHHCG